MKSPSTCLRFAFCAWSGLAVVGLTGCPSGNTTEVQECGDGGHDAASGADTGAPDGGTVDSGGHGGDAGDASSSTPPNPEVTYNDMTNPSNWSTFDTATLADGGASAGGYITSAFDGRYVYLVPGNGGVVPRYDTRAAFGSASSWSTFDVGTVDGSAGGFRGAAFDGRYVYLVPYLSGPTTFGGTVVQYDTHAPFGAAGSWSTFDTTTVDAAAMGFFGAVFDGRYLYLVPYGGDASQDGHVARYDTWASFTMAGSWTTFDTSTLGASVVGFYGGTFDGRYVYLSPYAYGNGDYGSLITRYDTQGNFTDAPAWSTFDTTTANGAAAGYFGSSFDGRYAYFVPYSGNGSPGGAVSRYDTTASFGAASSWSFFDSAAQGIAPAGAVFDGRYVYLVPSASPANSASGGSGLVARVDTDADFTNSSAWTTYDLTSMSPNLAGFFGGAFDGQYLYLVPSWHSVVARFDAKSPPSMPSSYHGSFY